MNLKLKELKKKTPQELLSYAEELKVENASSLRTQDMMFAILKNLAADNKEINRCGCFTIITRWFWFFKITSSNLCVRS